MDNNIDYEHLYDQTSIGLMISKLNAIGVDFAKQKDYTQMYRYFDMSSHLQDIRALMIKEGLITNNQIEG